MRTMTKHTLAAGVVLGACGTLAGWFWPSNNPATATFAPGAAVAANVRAAAGSGWATLSGKFVYQGTPPASKKLSTGGKDAAVCDAQPIPDESLIVDDQGRGIKNIVIFARKTSRVHESYEADAQADAIFDQKNCVFLSHVLPLRTSQTLVIKNSDPVGHNSNISPPGDAGINPLLPGGGEQRHQFKRPQTTPVAVTCNIHPWMKAYVLPRNDPYFAVTAADGSFTIANLPAGEELEFQVWHELGKGNQGALEAKKEWAKGRFKLKLTAGKAEDLGTIEVLPAAFK